MDGVFLLIDASNSFNSINRQAAILNSRVSGLIVPYYFLFNCYRGWAPLVVTDSDEI